jgi:hypothetical protein
VQQDTGDKLLTNLNCILICGINQLLCIILVLDTLVIHMLLKFCSQLVHRGHIRAQNAFNNSLLNELNFLLRELPAQEVIVRNIEQFNRLGSMEVLLDMILAVHLVSVGTRNNMVPIVEPIVLNIMTQGGYNDGQDVEIVKVSY